MTEMERLRHDLGAGRVLGGRDHLGGDRRGVGPPGQQRLRRADGGPCAVGGARVGGGWRPADLGRIAQFFSASVLLGFVFALALIITMKQIPKLLGIEVRGAELLRGSSPKTIQHLGDTSVVTLASGWRVSARWWSPALRAEAPRRAAGAGRVDRGLRRVRPGGARGSGRRGPALGPRRPAASRSRLDAVPLLFVGAVGIALLVFAEAMGPAEQFAKEHGYEVDANRELVALGGATWAPGLFHGFPIGASLSKSAANDRAGARPRCHSWWPPGRRRSSRCSSRRCSRTCPRRRSAPS